MTINVFGAGAPRRAFVFKPKGALTGCALAVLLQLFSGTTLAADALDRPVDLNIAADTPLVDALIEWGTKAGITLMINSEIVKSQRSRQVTGTLPARDALSLILHDSGLSYTRDGNRIRVVRPGTLIHSTMRDEPQAQSPSEFAVASAAPGSEESDVGGGGLALNHNIESEVVVTAQKREERIQDVPISIVALGADELAKRNITSIDDLTVVPGLALQDTGFQRRIALRGIANVQGNSSLTGIYLDEADVTSTGSGQLPLNTYDLQRVEVLRGPQGTLYGEGSIGGTVRFITNDPDLHLFEMKADVAALFTQGGAASQRIQEVLNVPLVDDQLALRVSGQFEHVGGWIDQPAANQKDINSQNNTDVRAKLLWRPVEAFSATGMVEIHRDQQTPSISEDPNGNFTQVFDLTTTPRVTNNYNLYNLTLVGDLGVARILNSTTYFNQDSEIYNWGHGLHTSPPPAPPTFALYAPLESTPESSFNDELRLTSTGTGPWQWTLGAFYRDFRFSWFEQYYFGLASAPLPPPLPDYYYSGQSKSWSVFADTSFKLTSRLTIGAGVRNYTDDEYYNYLGYQSATFHSVDPRYYIQYKLTDEVNVYGSAAKGFRSGGFNSVDQPTFGPENVWTYELGTKMGLMDQQLNLDADIFYSNYHGFISYGTPIGSPVGLTQNAGNAVIKGIEADITWRAGEGWLFSLGGDWLDSYFTKISLDPSTSAFAVGDNVDFVYKYQGNASVERDFKVTDKPVFVRVDYSIQGPSTYRNRSQGPWYFDESDTISMLNFNAGVQWNENLSLGLFAQNLLNDRGFTSSLILEDGALRARPRTYGVQFGVKF